MAELATGAAPFPITWEIIQTDHKIDEWERRFSLDSISLEELWNPLIRTPLGAL